MKIKQWKNALSGEHATDISWRKIIYSLDLAEETNVADGLRQYAEPPSGVI